MKSDGLDGQMRCANILDILINWHGDLAMDKEEYKVVWTGSKKDGETTAIGPLAALGFADQAKNEGAKVVKIIDNGIIQTFEEFEKSWLRD